jgi:hypothetical protein
LIIAKYNHKVKTVLKFSVWVYLSATITHLLTAIYVLNYGENSYTEALKLMAYFDFGAGFASSIGLIVSQVVEKLPRYNRSFTIGIIHAIGFVSPMIIAFIFIQNGENNDISKIICLVISSIFALFSAFNTDNIPDDALFRSGEKHSVKTWLGWLGLNPSLSEQDSEGDARSFWLSALTGANMIFFFFLFTNVNKVYIQKGLQNYEVIFCGYLGLSLGSIFWSWRAKVSGSRRKTIIQSNLLQLGVLLFFLVSVDCNWVFEASIFRYLVVVLGFSCSWVLTLVVLQIINVGYFRIFVV